MSQEVTESILRDLGFQKRNVENNLKGVLESCELDDGLSKAEIKNEKEWLEPLVGEFGEKTNTM